MYRVSELKHLNSDLGASGRGLFRSEESFPFLHLEVPKLRRRADRLVYVAGGKFSGEIHEPVDSPHIIGVTDRRFDLISPRRD